MVIVRFFRFRHRELIWIIANRRGGCIVSSKYVADFTSGSVPKQMAKFAFPLFVSNLLQAVYNMVDMIIVGQYVGKAGLSAVSVGGDVLNLLTFLAIGFANAGQVIIAQHLGAGKHEKIGKIIGNLSVFLLSGALVLSVITFAVREMILGWMNTPVEAWDYAYSYVSVCTLGLIFVYGYNIVSAVLRGMGDSKHPFIFIATAAVINLVLDIVFIAKYDMGAFGAALATVIGQGVSFFWGLIFILKNQKKLGIVINQNSLIIDSEVMQKLLKLGCPMAIKNAAIMFSKLFVNSWINSFGVIASSAAGIYSKINVISNLFSNAINMSASTMIGQNIGAGSHERVPKILRTAMSITLTVAAVLMVTIIAIPEVIFGMFTTDIEVIEEAMLLIPMLCVLFFGSACRAPSNGLIDGSGNYKLNFFVAFLDGIINRIGFAMLFGLVILRSWSGFLWGDVIAGFTPFVVGVIYYRTGKWKKGYVTH